MPSDKTPARAADYYRAIVIGGGAAFRQWALDAGLSEQQADTLFRMAQDLASIARKLGVSEATQQVYALWAVEALSWRTGQD